LLNNQIQSLYVYSSYCTLISHTSLKMKKKNSTCMVTPQKIQYYRRSEPHKKYVDLSDFLWVDLLYPTGRFYALLNFVGSRHIFIKVHQDISLHSLHLLIRRFKNDCLYTFGLRGVVFLTIMNFGSVSYSRYLKSAYAHLYHSRLIHELRRPCNCLLLKSTLKNKCSWPPHNVTEFV